MGTRTTITAEWFVHLLVTKDDGIKPVPHCLPTPHSRRTLSLNIITHSSACAGETKKKASRCLLSKRVAHSACLPACLCLMSACQHNAEGSFYTHIGGGVVVVHAEQDNTH